MDKNISQDRIKLESHVVLHLGMKTVATLGQIHTIS